MSKTSLLNKFLRTLPRGKDICKEGDPSGDFLILISGTVGIYKDGKKITTVSEPGSYLGEMAAILNENRSATMRAETEIKAYVMPSANLEKLITASPIVGLKLIKTFANRLSQANSGSTSESPSADSAPAPASDGAAADYKALIFLLEKVYEKGQQPFLEAILAFAKKSPLASSDAEFGAPLEEVTRILSMVDGDNDDDW